MDNNRRLYIRCRLSEAERLMLDKLREAEAAKTSEIVRMALRELARQRGLWPAGAQEKEGQR